ncbi:MAG: thioredoxin family protein [Armatimonadetes bacterium]|nr:thioredoxin family protein [Armatimonadota bacterium]
MRKAFFAVVLALMAIFAMAQTGDPVKWTAKLEQTSLRAGEKGRILITGVTQPDWYFYGTKKYDEGPISLEIALNPTDSKGVKQAGALVEPPPGKKHDKNFGIDVEYHEGDVVLALPIEIDAGATGTAKAVISKRYQSCTKTTCARPDATPLTVEFPIEPGAARPEFASASTEVPDQPNNTSMGHSGDAPKPAADSGSSAKDATQVQIEQAKKSGLFSFLLLAFGAGLTALLTPCVFPMIPITVSFFTKRGGESGRDIRGALAYCMGILLSFTGVGLAVTAIFGASGIQKLATNPIVNFFLAALFIFLAMSLFGLFELVLPQGMVNKFSSKSRSGGLAGPIFMGVTFSLTTFTCTVPFVGTLLLSATQGEWTYPALGMLSFSTAFALPFFLLALFPQWLGKLPKSGSWLATVKAFMGFLELAAALKFLSNIDLVYTLGWITRPVFLSIWSSIMILAGLYLLGWIKLGHSDEAIKIGWLRRGFGVASVLAAGWCLAGIQGAPLGKLSGFLPPDPYPNAAGRAKSSGSELPWLDSFDTAVEQAKAERKAVFIDFTGVTCTNCRDMEANVFPDSAVQTQFKRVVRAKLFTDRIGIDDKNAELQTKLTNSKTLPVYVVLDPNTGKPVKILGGSGHSPADFAKFIEEGIAMVEGTDTSAKR